MKKLVIFFLMAISPSLFAEEIVLRNLYVHIPIEDEELEWKEGDKGRFEQQNDEVYADLSDRVLTIEFREAVSYALVNVVDQITGDAIVEESYTTPFVITIPLITALPGGYMLEIYTGEDAYGAKFELE